MHDVLKGMGVALLGMALWPLPRLMMRLIESSEVFIVFYLAMIIFIVVHVARVLLLLVGGAIIINWMRHRLAREG